MQVHHSNVSVLRQASLAVRNMVARSVELRSRFLHDELEIEPLLRKAQQYQGCGDEAYAALRDLGCYIQLSSLVLSLHYRGLSMRPRSNGTLTLYNLSRMSCMIV